MTATATAPPAIRRAWRDLRRLRINRGYADGRTGWRSDRVVTLPPLYDRGEEAP
jgi:hypothetical protein